MASTTPSVRVIKHFTYRGDDFQKWSNRYHFTGALPADTAAWNAIFDGLLLLEKTIITGRSVIEKMQGFGPGNDLPLAEKSFTQAGTGSFGGSPVPGDCAAVVRQATTKMSTKHHTVYVFSYVHGVEKAAADNSGDALAAGQKTALENYYNAWVSGISIGGINRKRCTPDGATVTGTFVSPWIGHRDFLN